MSHLISVVIPVYNRENLVTESLESVRANSYRPIELVVVDDGSTDASLSRVEQWAVGNRAADFAVIVVSKDRGGASSARNAGLRASAGDLVLFLDSDDVLYREMISSQVELIESTGADYAYGRTRQIGSDGSVYAILGRALGGGVSCIPDHNWHLSSVVMRRASVDRAGLFDENLPTSNDWEFSCRLKAVGGVGVFNSGLLSEYRIHRGAQLVKSDRGLYAGSRQVALTKVYQLISALPGDATGARRKLSWLMFGNCLEQVRRLDYGSYRSSMQFVCEWSNRWRRLFYTFAAGVLSAYCLGVRGLCRPTKTEMWRRL